MSDVQISRRTAGTEDFPIKPYAVPIRTAQVLLGDKSRREIYVEVGRGNLVALKDGRKTLLTMASTESYVASLPVAKFKSEPPRQQRGRKARRKSA